MNMRHLLQTELSRRCERNPKYSLRAFAKALGMSHATLSQVISGKRPVSRKSVRKISECLALGPERRALGVAPSEFEQIGVDTFSIISDWYHYAILSLLETPSSSIDPRWIARRLGISLAEAAGAVDRLKRLELIERRDGRWRQKGKRLRVDNVEASAAARKFHRQLLAKALESLENDPKPMRDFEGITLAFDPREMPYAIERLNSYARELAVELQKRGRPSEVYELAVQFFPVSRRGEER
jgi:uncharacterized protein (TIGR02147 family)